MGQKLYDAVAPIGGDGRYYWLYDHEGLIVACIILVIVIFVAVLAFVLAKLIKKGDPKNIEHTANADNAADDQIKPKE